jgi:lipoyl-dependent peroxiredoxin
MNTFYSTKVTATGGRHGQLRSEDGLLEMKLAVDVRITVSVR